MSAAQKAIKAYNSDNRSDSVGAAFTAFEKAILEARSVDVEGAAKAGADAYEESWLRDSPSEIECFRKGLRAALTALFEPMPQQDANGRCPHCGKMNAGSHDVDDLYEEPVSSPVEKPSVIVTVFPAADESADANAIMRLAKFLTATHGCDYPDKTGWCATAIRLLTQQKANLEAAKADIERLKGGREYDQEQRISADDCIHRLQDERDSLTAQGKALRKVLTDGEHMVLLLHRPVLAVSPGEAEAALKLTEPEAGDNVEDMDDAARGTLGTRSEAGSTEEVKP